MNESRVLSITTPRLRLRAPRRINMPRRRLAEVPRRARSKLEAIYLIQHNMHRIEQLADMARLTVADFDGVPDSDGLAIGEWLARCADAFVVVEDAS